MASPGHRGLPTLLVVSQFAPPPIMKVVLVVCVVIIVLSLIFLFLPLAGIHFGGVR